MDINTRFSKASENGNLEQVLRTKQPTWKKWFSAIRFHQWVKNLLVFVPLLASHKFLNLDLFLSGLLAFFCFSLCSSSVYLLNDLLDLEYDRIHPVKRNRPFASGALPLKSGFLAIPLLLVLAFSLGYFYLPAGFTISMGVYLLLNMAYSTVLKRVIILDVIILALLYTLRVIAGTFAVGLILTFWMLAFSMFIFLSLALVKRYTEILQVQNRGKNHIIPGRCYCSADSDIVLFMGICTGLLSVLILAMYIQADTTSILYSSPELIWPACPLLLYWVSRIWLITHRGEMHDDPVIFALKDKTSMISGIFFGLVFWLAWFF